jgi:hypothetical protein
MTPHTQRRTRDLPRSSGESTHDAASGGGLPESADAWLGLFSNLLHMRASEKDSITQEIGSHLRERIRDLMLEGYNETNAIHAATRELGDAAELAKKFESVAKGRTRRHIMYFAILGTGILTTAAAGVLILRPALNDQNDGAVSYFEQAPTATAAEPPPAATEATITITPDMTLRDIVHSISQASGVGIVVDWRRMEEIGLIAGDVPIEAGLEADAAAPLLLLQALQAYSGDTLDWRFRDQEMLELGTKEDFDLTERVLASYDIAATIQRLRDEYELEYEAATLEITQLITGFVEPELWEDNGGLIAQLEVVGGTLFINAPPRMHERTAWILNELDQQPKVGGILHLEADQITIEGGR